MIYGLQIQADPLQTGLQCTKTSDMSSEVVAELGMRSGPTDSTSLVVDALERARMSTWSKELYRLRPTTRWSPVDQGRLFGDIGGSHWKPTRLRGAGLSIAYAAQLIAVV
jgi:hypothetical protein